MTERGLTVTSPAKLMDGSTSWTDSEYQRDTWILPDWTIVDSPGYFYTRWGAGGRAGMELAPSVRAGARIADTRSYASGSEVSVRIWRTWSEYSDITEMLDADSGMPVLKIAENMPGSATFAMDADWETPSRNPLSSSYANWAVLVSGTGSADAGAVSTGMYATVHVLKGGAWTMVWGGHVSTLTPESGRLRFECADGLAVLARQGATLRRNYYDKRTPVQADVSYSGGLYADLGTLPQGAVVDTSGMQYKVKETWDEDDTIDGDITRTINGYVPILIRGAWEYVRWAWVVPEDMEVGEVNVHLRVIETLADARLTIEASAGGRSVTSERVTASALFEGWKSFRLDFQVARGEKLTLRLIGAESGINLAIWSGPEASYSPIRGEWVVEGDRERGRCPDWEIIHYFYRPCRGTVQSGNRVRVTQIDGVGSLSDADLVNPPYGRLLCAYYTPSASRDAIMADLITGFGGLPFIAGSTDAEVAAYRVGGGFMQQYLLKIAEVSGSSGGRRTIAARGFTVMAIASGVQHSRGDLPALVVCPAATGYLADAVEFVSFSPRLTLKNRPSLAVLRGSWGTGDEAIPMMVAVESASSTSQRGLCIEAVVTDSEASDVPSAMHSAWAALDADSLDVWEGTLVLPGFRPELIEQSGPNAGSGAIISVHDERYGFGGLRVAVKEVRADWGKWQTEVTVTSYSPVYASTVPDTAAAVQMAGDLATGSGMLYKTQYVRVVTTAASGASTVEVATEDGAEDDEWWECEDVSVGRAGSSAVVTARIWGTAVQNTDYEERYSIAKIRLDGSTVIDIDPYRRPDLYTGQVLIVQIDCQSSS